MAKGNFHACHAITARWEGGWSDHDRDPGGATMYGVTIGTLSKWRGRKVTKAEVKALTRKEAEQIYKAWYWDAVKGDKLPAGVDLAVYDFSVNSGPARARKYLQRAVGVKQDGAIGPVTMEAVNKADPVELIETLCGHRMKFLKGLSTWDAFGKGWTNRVNDVTFQAVKMVGSKPAAPSLPNGKSGGFLAILARILRLILKAFGK